MYFEDGRGFFCGDLEGEGGGDERETNGIGVLTGWGKELSRMGRWGLLPLL